jgi:hypothetical protein
METDEWLSEGLPKALSRLEDEFCRGLQIMPSWWGRFSNG